MISKHEIYFDNSLFFLEHESVHLTVTSPPYPMIEMWDECFCNQNPFLMQALNQENIDYSFEAMHSVLDVVWTELFRVTKPGGIVCINIGDATRSIGGSFRLFSNHSRIIDKMLEIGFVNLPNIIWRKPSNSPTKFLGSGVLPGNAYVTLEHEYILVFRKGHPRVFSKKEADLRRKSAMFWEERNQFYSDLWEIPGIKQKIHDSKTRSRSAAYPIEIPYRLINMFSIYGDIVLDPFCGLGTTNLCALMLARNSFGVEIDERLFDAINKSLLSKEIMREYLDNRIQKHIDFVKNKGCEFFKYNQNGMPVKTKQETNQEFYYIDSIENIENTWQAKYKKAQSDAPFKD